MRSGTKERTAAQAEAAEARAEERMRRRFARRQWARRWGVWRPLLALLAFVVVVAAGVWLVWFSDVLAVEKVSVSGTDHLSASEVRAAADVPMGRPLARLDLAGAERRVESLAAVEAVRVERVWPRGVRVVVTERSAVAVVEIGGRVRGMDAEGVVFRDYAKVPKNLPRVRVVGSVDREALEEAATVLSAMPDDLARIVRRVDVQTIDHISLVLRGDRTVLWGSGEFSEDKAAVLAALLKAQKATSYDVSVPGQPVVQ
ncbi:cell division protein FtsQ/DivIB [Nocardioides jishulii]|uniref:Cell division protein FtsQ n=1 Tax=Nocardioides jishulii TaxID=2575440 RepID=A0A4U2YKK2_9ACTN|nr:FtsQ-type POTRA domain-containing protein [Nocardioides jishulii]QCX27183.1 FtsQ-type POTRA domain-containing protein [Nocardioides jishulii]TKI61668.1 FtsQ-type POTRA domain-containing protein [Nocardioides jishulii]